MIAGLGMDVVKTERIRLLLERYGEAFLNRIFAEDELGSAREAVRSPERIAGNFAAKEAASKALGCGFGSSCAVTDIHVSRDPSGAPKIVFSGAAAKQAEKLGVARVLVTITHEKEYAASVVVLESF
ncbi:MAG: holo-ACP synthase [Lentisphaeria bacterium]|nr:holo-ACP synthase [Lentisphaeria bacterium]